MCAPLGHDRPVVAGLRDHDDRPFAAFPLENALAAQDETADLVDAIGQKDHAAAFADMIERILDRLGVVVEPSPLASNSRLASATRLQLKSLAHATFKAKAVGLVGADSTGPPYR